MDSTARLAEIDLVRFRVVFKIVEEVGQLFGDHRPRLGGKHHVAVRAHDVAVALAFICQTAEQFFQCGVVVAQRQRRIGDTIYCDGLYLHGKHDLAHPFAGDIAGHDGAVGSVKLRQRSLHVRGVSLPAADCPILVFLIEKHCLTVLPGRAFLHICAPFARCIRIAVQIFKVFAPDLKDVPVPLHEHVKGLGHLTVGGKQVCRALAADLLTGVSAVEHDAH